LILLSAGCASHVTSEGNARMIANRASTADAPPRKVVIGTIMHTFRGDLAARLKSAEQLVDAAAAEAAKKYPGKGLDLVVLPENALKAKDSGDEVTAMDKAVPLEGAVLDTMGALARKHKSYVIVPITLREEKPTPHATNSAVLLDRQGKVVGTYRKVHPVTIWTGTLESGITPGREYPVFNTDFGKLGIQICWDMSYEDGFAAMAKQGVEIIAISSASPQTVRPAAYALRMGCYVVTSTPRDNVTVFNPAGMVAAQSTNKEVLVHEIDLSYAIVHWAKDLKNGEGLTEKFGDKVGYQYSVREDTGVFWSNDPKRTVGSMIRELNLVEMHAQTARDRKAQDAARGGPVAAQ
jgi:predicted amidohydrolase